MGGTPKYDLPASAYVDRYKMPKLDREIKSYINMGLFSLYVLQDNAHPGAKFVLYNDEGAAFLLDEEGAVIQQGKLPRYPVKESVDFPTIRVPYRMRK